MSAQEQNKDIVRAANLIILRKVRDKMKIDRATFELEMGIKKSSIDNIIARKEKAATNWKYGIVAQKMKMNEKVFSGEYLLHVGTTITEDAIRIIDDKAQQVLGEEVSEMKEELAEIKRKMSESEYWLWEVILNDMDDREKDPASKEFVPLGDSIGQQSKMSILEDVGRQVDEESFNDDQLWKFWNYFRKLQ